MAIRYRKFQPSEYVMAVKKGKVVRQGLGLSVLYNTMRTSLQVIPATEAELDMLLANAPEKVFYTVDEMRRELEKEGILK